MRPPEQADLLGAVVAPWFFVTISKVSTVCSYDAEVPAMGMQRFPARIAGCQKGLMNLTLDNSASQATLAGPRTLHDEAPGLGDALE